MDYIRRKDAIAVLNNALYGYSSDDVYEIAVAKMDALPGVEIEVACEVCKYWQPVVKMCCNYDSGRYLDIYSDGCSFGEEK